MHLAPEGLYIHQMGHILLSFSMGILIYWLRERRLVQAAGWRYIQYAAVFFILWNIDSMVAHYFDERNDIFERIDAGTWHGYVHLTHEDWELALMYYLAKMDHLLALPAMVFLYAGLRRLLEQARTEKAGSETL